MSEDELYSGTRSLHEAALDELPWPILIHDQQHVLFANCVAAQALGARSSAELKGRPISEIVHPDGVEAGATRRRIVMERGHVITDVPVKLVGLDGITRYAIVTGRPIIHGDAENAILVTAVMTRTDDPAE